MRRRARRQSTFRVLRATGWENALAVLAESMAHGETATVHLAECPANHGFLCDCDFEFVGPAVRGEWN